MSLSLFKRLKASAKNSSGARSPQRLGASWDHTIPRVLGVAVRKCCVVLAHKIETLIETVAHSHPNKERFRASRRDICNPQLHDAHPGLQACGSRAQASCIVSSSDVMVCQHRCLLVRRPLLDKSADMNIIRRPCCPHGAGKMFCNTHSRNCFRKMPPHEQLSSPYDSKP